MARARNIKPGFFKNEALADIEPLGRLLFAGLWCLADREGRLEDRPKRIKIEVIPYDDIDVDMLLTKLADKGFIERYSVDNENYIQIVNFQKHQNPHHKEVTSEIPPPLSMNDSSMSQAYIKHEPSMTTQASADPACNFNLVTDSLNLVTEEDHARDNKPTNITLSRTFEKEFGRPITPIEFQQIQQWEKEHQQEIIQEALKRAVLLGKFNFKYIDAILFEWHKNNIRTAKEVLDYEDKFKKRVRKSRTPTDVDKFKSLYQ